MPADFSALIDTLLVLAGLVLVATGLVMFIYSKTSTQASSVEAFGIKLNVTHPSLILVLAGVGLMLAPRLLPGLPGKADDKPAPAVVAEAPQPEAAESAMGPRPEATAVPMQPPAPPAPEAALPPASTPAKSAAKPSTASLQPATTVKPRVAVPETASRQPAPRVATARPAAAPAAPVQPEEAVITPPAAAKPARPTLAFAALGLPISRSFWGGETRASYTQRVNATLQQAGRDVLRMDARGLELGQAGFDSWWNESRQHPRSRELCDSSHAPRALLSARVESPTTISSVESAYWPELKLRLYVCADQRLYRQQKTLSPQNDDAWPFATELNSEIERFLRAYRNDLSD
ncbi:MAG: hypothetical protein A2X71_08495 [Thiobacillus sp. GWE1_62_9]|nr:MAG: hypothetical protein A2X71_08495 [Thiobacillus sp. GWE1_62_9]HBU30667.1 hypothetical protein [Thiobacillus sp.]